MPAVKAQAEHLILVEELTAGSDFDKAGAQSEGHRRHASPQARFERLLRETGISIGLLTSPERIRLVYAPAPARNAAKWQWRGPDPCFHSVHTLSPGQALRREKGF